MEMHTLGVDELVKIFEAKALSGKVRAESLHPFDRKAFLTSLRENLNSFTSDMTKGYKAIADTAIEIGEKGIQIAGIPAYGKKSMRAVKGLFPAKEDLKDAYNPDMINDAIERGLPLFEIMGLAPQAIANMYAISFYLLEQERNEQANYAFRLLTILAPYMADFWIGSGVASLRLNDLLGAREVFERALVLDPSSLEALVLLCRVLVQQGSRGEAEARLSAKVDEAARKGDQRAYEAYDKVRFELSSFGA